MDVLVTLIASAVLVFGFTLAHPSNADDVGDGHTTVAGSEHRDTGWDKCKGC